VNKNTSNHAVKGELGSWGLMTYFVSHSIKYWFRICDSDKNSLLYKSYLENYQNLTHKPVNSNWCTFIRHILTEFDLETVWDNQGSKKQNKILWILKERIQNRYESNWKDYISNFSSKLKSYKLFKNKFQLENYIIKKKFLDRINFTKLRISAHKLHCETGRYTKPKTPASLRFCPSCPNDIENEYHFIIDCKNYDTCRQELYSSLDIPTFKNLTKEDKFIFLMSYNNGNIKILNYILNFINEAFLLRLGHADGT